MSKENASLFIRAMTEDTDLGSKVSGADRNSGEWTRIGNEAGFEFAETDFHALVSELIGVEDLKPECTVDALIELGQLEPTDGELSDSDMNSVAGGAGSWNVGEFNFTSTIFRRLQTIGFAGGKMGSASVVVDFPPHFVQGSSERFSNFSKFRF